MTDPEDLYEGPESSPETELEFLERYWTSFMMDVGWLPELPPPPYFLWSQFEIFSNSATIIGYTEELDINPYEMPSTIHITGNSGYQQITFSPDPDAPFHTLDEEGTDTWYYLGTLEDRKWFLTIYMGKREGPDWSQYPTGTQEWVNPDVPF